MIIKFIMWYLKRKLLKLQKEHNTQYFYITETDKDYPNYLVFTNSKEYRNKIHKII